MKMYSFTGSVTIYGKVVANTWSSKTFAPTKEKAKANLKYQFRSRNNYQKNIPIELHGEVIEC